MRRYLSLLLAVGLLAGCSKAATIMKKDGSVVEAEIIRSDEPRIYVIKGPDRDDLFFETIPIERNEISDIEHPGNVHAGLGTTFALASTVPIALGGALMAKPDPKEDDDFESGGSLGAFVISDQTRGAIALGIGLGIFATSLPMAIYGWVVWGRSKIRATQPDDATATADPASIRFLGIAPLVDSDREVKGLTLGFRF